MCARAVICFQAEDGIRDIGVTGVQTCALPDLPVPVSSRAGSRQAATDLPRAPVRFHIRKDERHMRRVEIFDTTLRDGEQSPGISLSVEEKVEIARQLARLKVDVIEAGFPITSEGDFESRSEEHTSELQSR